MFGRSYTYSPKPVIVFTDFPTYYLARNKCRQGVSLGWSAATSAPFSFLPVRKAGRGSEVFPWFGLNRWGWTEKFDQRNKNCKYESDVYWRAIFFQLSLGLYVPKCHCPISTAKRLSKKSLLSYRMEMECIAVPSIRLQFCTFGIHSR